MVEKVSDWVSQDGVLEEELVRNIVSSVNVNVEPNVLWCTQQCCHNRGLQQGDKPKQNETGPWEGS